MTDSQNVPKVTTWRRVRPTGGQDGDLRSHPWRAAVYVAAMTAAALATVWALIGDQIHHLLERFHP